MAGDADVVGFYDGLADDYHLIFEDWDATIARQAGVITRLLRESYGLTSGAVLDASCGIGTQAIGLASAGFDVTASDISPASVSRCAQEATNRGVSLTTMVADLRLLDLEGAGRFDAVLSFDNALPHLLEDEDLEAACVAMRRVLRPGGMLLASIRDYDAVLVERSLGDLPRRFETDEGERIVFQVWEWTSDDRYCVRHFIMNHNETGWTVSERTATYRALPRTVLSSALEAAGFRDIEWRLPEATGFYQPIVSAHVR